jgi:2-C-methyl-D-erythritol 4-phosphate cytidylyltransferase
VVTGGATRPDSVRIGLADVPEEVAVILVHDAARPLVSGAVIERVLAPLGEGWDGAAPAVPVADTLKRAAADGSVLETVDRTGLHAVQTPQAFVATVLRGAFTGADARTTDCAALVEAAGGRVRLVDGDTRLLKVTTSADLALVEALLAGE